MKRAQETAGRMTAILVGEFEVDGDKLAMRMGFAVSRSGTVAGLSFLSCAILFGQDTHRRVPDVSDPELSQHVKRQRDSVLNGKLQLRGAVRLVDGSVPEQAVELEAACAAFSRLMATTDSHGNFRFRFDQNRQSDNELAANGCVLRARLPGYRSEGKSFADLMRNSNTNFGTIVLRQIANSDSGLVSAADRRATAAERRMYEKALDKAAGQDYQGAIRLLTELVSRNAGYSSAWLALGRAQEMERLPRTAEKSYRAAMRADPQFALPLIRVAELEILGANAAGAREDAQKAIERNREAFPEAYLIVARAEMTLGDMRASAGSAEAGIALDADHEYPELEYMAGMAFYSAGDRARAEAHLKNYLEQAPSGLNVTEAGKKLAQTREAERVTEGLKLEASSEAAGPGSHSEQDTTAVEDVRAHNRPLLEHLSALTCLESISTWKQEPLHEATMLPPVRVEVALSDGREMYGAVGGKGFSEDAATAAQSSFRTTGIFGSIARTLITGDQLAIEAKGALRFGSETLDRFDFHSLQGTGGWDIHYNGEAGTAAEQGWFLTDSKSGLLRRVFVTALDIPKQLKLISVRAMVDYVPETIAGRRALLPSAARIDAIEESGVRHTSFASFHHWRAFMAESVVEFAETSSVPSTKKAGEVYRLPAGLEIRVALDGALNVMADSDAVVGRVLQPVMHRRRRLIETGARVEAHVGRKLGSGAIVLELDRVQSLNGWTPFYAEPIRMDLPAGVQMVTADEERAKELTSGFDPMAELPETEVPGVVKLHFADTNARVPAGAEMWWRTVSPVTTADVTGRAR
ncbi:MAG TPA: hypothetical protein VKX25_07070 [Bryobacteraceae bacterium]|jgi:tetratricopeptide (TPR) repeat protein|nr:hypothetical protein [Bryobacteraceae bacterium]